MLCTSSKLLLPRLDLGGQGVVELLERVEDAHDLALDLDGRDGDAKLFRISGRNLRQRTHLTSNNPEVLDIRLQNVVEVFHHHGILSRIRPQLILEREWRIAIDEIDDTTRLNNDTRTTHHIGFGYVRFMSADDGTATSENSHLSIR